MSRKINLESILAKTQQRIEQLSNYIEAGVEIVDPLTTYIAAGVKIGEGTIIYPLTFIESDVTVGCNCRIGPYARIRSGTTIEDEVIIGNFTEINRSHLKNQACIKHFSYLGDTEVGGSANIGAGTVVANYDGKRKHRTIIKKGAFIGSGSILVAPVEIGQGAVTGAGAVVTKGHNVADNTTVVGVPAKEINNRKQENSK
jgi:bifunctional UDP-N-acetylglucosamine pyrophosphorylase/glucosamine-1-phosphate N-acetyltransferase